MNHGKIRGLTKPSDWLIRSGLDTTSLWNVTTRTLELTQTDEEILLLFMELQVYANNFFTMRIILYNCFVFSGQTLYIINAVANLLFPFHLFSNQNDSSKGLSTEVRTTGAEAILEIKYLRTLWNVRPRTCLKTSFKNTRPAFIWGTPQVFKY